MTILRLEPFTEDHAMSEHYYDWLNTPEIVRYLGLPAYLKGVSRSELVSYFQSLKPQVDYFFAVYHPDFLHFIGTLKLGHYDRNSQRIEIGMLIGEPQCRGKGLGTELIGLGTEYAFLNLDAHRVQCGVFSSNIASQKCFERNGYRQEGLLMDYYRLEDRYENYILYAILKDEWLGNKAK